MSQLSYSQDQAPSFAGLKADSRFDHVDGTKLAKEQIEFGSPVGAEAGEETYLQVPRADNAKLVFDADFVTSNTINLDVNGESIAEVTFDTDHDTTADLLVDAINALAGVTCQLDSADVNNRTFLIESDGEAITVDNVVVAGGASQADDTVTYSADDVFRGVALHQHNEEGYYKAERPVNTLRQGAVWVPTSVAVTKDDKAYADVTNVGKFTNVSTGNIDTGGYFQNTIASAGLAVLEINLP